MSINQEKLLTDRQTRSNHSNNRPLNPIVVYGQLPVLRTFVHGNFSITMCRKTSLNMVNWSFHQKVSYKQPKCPQSYRIFVHTRYFKGKCRQGVPFLENLTIGWSLSWLNLSISSKIQLQGALHSLRKLKSDCLN